MKILAFETSCDETAVAIVEPAGHGPVRVLAHTIYSQIDLHRPYGGVYPEAASREHLAKIGIILERTLADFQNSKSKTQKSGEKLQDVVRDEIDAIAVTAGPGLIGSLLVGVNVAKTLAFALKKPLIPINHHEGHIAAAWIDQAGENQKSEIRNQKLNEEEEFSVPELPALALVVSGGHTKLISLPKPNVFEEIGRTRDDAAGEAFDKVARLIDLPYPGGPQISALAEKFRTSKPQIRNNPTIHLPRPMLDSGDFDFSFSGLKTAVARVMSQTTDQSEAFRAELAFAFEEAAIDVLVSKTLAAAAKYQPKSIILAGGVAANHHLRAELIRRTSERSPNIMVYIPPIELCTDNAAMIGAAAIRRALAGQEWNWYDVVANDHYPLNL